MKISIQSLSKAFGSRELLSDFSLELEGGVRLAVVGPNGVGKSTLLRILAGVEEPDAGRVTYPSVTRLGYTAQELPQDQLDTPLLTWVLDALPDMGAFWRAWDHAVRDGDQVALARLGGRQAEIEHSYGYNPEHRARRTLSGLGFRDDDLGRPLGALSGGWRERAKLARVLTAGADILLLDEPTNHLDLEAVRWLEQFLLDYQGVLVFVAHDRVFLDRVSTHVLVLGGLRPSFRKGSFSEFLEWQEEMEEQKRRQAKHLASQVERKMEFVDRFRAKATKARQAASKRKQAIRLEREIASIELEPQRRTLDFAWPEPEQSDKTVLSAVGLEFAFPGGPDLWPALDFQIYRGQKIALVGPNGCGKSTLLGLITGRLQPRAGRTVLGQKVRVGYYSQHQLEILRSENAVLSEMRRLCDPRTTEEQLMGSLGLFQLGSGWFDRQVAGLSGGEKSRLVLASLFLMRANFLVLDEPTNHLDLESREALIEALEDFPGTVLLVAHDRWLLSRVAEQAWALSERGMIVHEDGFAGYERASLEAAADRAETPRVGQTRVRECGKEEKRRQAELRNALYREMKPRQDEYAALERELEEILVRQSELEQALADPEAYADPERGTEMVRSYRRCQEDGEYLLERMGVLEQEIADLEAQRKDSPA